jgi:hypothetical protein
MRGARNRRRERELLLAKVTRVLGPLPQRAWRLRTTHKTLIVFVILGMIVSIVGPVAFADDTPPDATPTASPAPSPTDTPSPTPTDSPSPSDTPSPTPSETPSSSPTIASDQADYVPGATVTLAGTGWAADEAVHIFVNDDAGQTWNYSTDVSADSSGGFTVQFQLPNWFVATYTVTATGSSGLVAQTTFTDGTPQMQTITNTIISPNQPSSAGVLDSTDFTVRNQGGGTVNNITIRIRVGTLLTGTLVRELTVGTLNSNTNSSPITWDGKDNGGAFVADGTYTARAFSPTTGENDGSSMKFAIVVDNTNPTVTLNSPADNALVSGGITLDTSPLDAGGNDSNVDKVEFYVNNILVGTDGSAGGGWNISYNTTSLADGDYPWFARAFDKAGNHADSSTRTLKIRNDGYYTAVISPTSAVTGSTVSYTLTFTNTTPVSGLTMGSVQVGIPTGAGTPSSVSVSAFSSSNASLTWLVDSAPAGFMRFQRTGNSSQNVGPGGRVVIQFNATASTAGSKEWTTTAYMNQNYTQPFDLQGTQPTVQVAATATLTVIKHVINNNGGTAVASNFTMSVTGRSPSPASFAGAESPGTTVTIIANTAYSVGESGPSGYTMTSTAGCSSVTGLPAGGSATCTITNDDQAATLIVKKHVVNDNGGTAAASDFTMTVTGGSPSPASLAGNEGGTTDTLNAGS